MMMGLDFPGLVSLWAFFSDSYSGLGSGSPFSSHLGLVVCLQPVQNLKWALLCRPKGENNEDVGLVPALTQNSSQQQQPGSVGKWEPPATRAREVLSGSAARSSAPLLQFYPIQSTGTTLLNSEIDRSRAAFYSCTNRILSDSGVPSQVVHETRARHVCLVPVRRDDLTREKQHTKNQNLNSTVFQSM